MHDIHTAALVTMTIPQSWSSLIGGGQAGHWPAPQEPGNYIPKMARWGWKSCLLHNPTSHIQTEEREVFERRELWNSFPFLINGALVIDRHLLVSCGQSLQQLCYMQIVVTPHMPNHLNQTTSKTLENHLCQKGHISAIFLVLRLQTFGLGPG